MFGTGWCSQNYISDQNVGSLVGRTLQRLQLVLHTNCCLVGHWDSLNPFCEVVLDNQEVAVVLLRPWDFKYVNSYRLPGFANGHTLLVRGGLWGILSLDCWHAMHSLHSSVPHPLPY